MWGKSLCDTFPTLYMLTETKGAKVAKVWDNSRGGGALVA